MPEMATLARPPRPAKAPPHRFTRDNAREMQRRSTETQARNRATQAAAITLDLVPSSDPHEKPPDEPNYVRLRLMRVRRQLDRIDLLVLTETDPQKLDRLASAQAKLSEQERQLADRPLPGSKRPAPAKASRGSAMIAPLDGQME